MFPLHAQSEYWSVRGVPWCNIVDQLAVAVAEAVSCEVCDRQVLPLGGPSKVPVHAGTASPGSGLAAGPSAG